jgi:hypothetical protein
MTRRLFYFLLFFSIVFFTACGSDGSDAGDGTSASNTTATSDVFFTTENDTATSSPTDSAPPPADIATAPRDSSTTSTDTGTQAQDVGSELDSQTELESPEVSSELIQLGGGILLYEVKSEFVNTAGAGARLTDFEPLDGTGDIYGPCVAAYSDPDEVATAKFGYDAGVISVTATTPAVTLTPADEGSDGTGYVSNLDTDLAALLPPAGLLTISAAGGADIGSFIHAVHVPEAVTLSSPSVGLFDSHDASQDLDVVWNAGSGDSVLVTLSPLSGIVPEPTAGLALVCASDGDPGAMTIPAAALTALTQDGVDKVALGVTRLRVSEADTDTHIIPVVVTRSTGGPLGL